MSSTVAVLVTIILGPSNTDLHAGALRVCKTSLVGAKHKYSGAPPSPVRVLPDHACSKTVCLTLRTRMASLTVVEHLQSRATSCGYCHAGRDSDGEGNDDEEAGTSKSFGMLVPSLTPEQYEGLLERGWRRSGTYIYRPYNDATCCPQHPIRLKAMDFQASKVSPKHHHVHSF